MAIDGANSGSTAGPAGPAMPSVRSPTSPIRPRARAGSLEQIAVIRKSSTPAARSAAYPRRWAGTIRPAPISPIRTGGIASPARTGLARRCGAGELSTGRADGRGGILAGRDEQTCPRPLRAGRVPGAHPVRGAGPAAVLLRPPRAPPLQRPAGGADPDHPVAAHLGPEHRP